MNIYVLMKQVPVISDIKINHQTFSVEREGAGTMMNPADVHAISAAVALKKSFGGSITVLTMGNESCEVQLREAAGMGADRLVRITDNAFAEQTPLSQQRFLPLPSGTSALRTVFSADRLP